MKKLICVALILTVVLSLVGCSGGKTVELPLKGFHGFDNGLIIEVDESLFFTQEYKAIENAYVFDEGELVKLKANESEFKLNPEISNVTEETTLEIKYYVHNDTVYCYQKTDYRLQGITFEFISIPNDPKNVLIHGTVMKNPMILNVKSGEITPLFDKTEYCQLSGLTTSSCISDDGQYVVIRGGTKYDAIHNTLKIYVLNLKTGKEIEVLTPQYDQQKYERCFTSPYAFVGDELIVTYTMEYERDTTKNYSETYYFNLENGEMRKWDNDIAFDKYSIGYPGHHILMKKVVSSGECYLYNIKTNKKFYYKSEISTEIYGTPNESGRFILGGLKEWPTHNIGSVDSGIEPYITHALIDMEKGKIVDISKYVKDFTITEYKGETVINTQWIDETNLLVVYGNEAERYTDIVDLSSVME